MIENTLDFISESGYGQHVLIVNSNYDVIYEGKVSEIFHKFNYGIIKNTSIHHIESYIVKDKMSGLLLKIGDCSND